MKVKVCGMRDPENLKELSKLPIDYIGFIFFEKSKRNITEEIDKELLKSIKQDKVGVFVNEKIEIVLSKVDDYSLDFVQLHGDETPKYCKHLKDLKSDLKIIKVFSVGETFDFQKTVSYEAVADYFLFDTKGKERGGNGVQFNWEILEEYQGEIPFLLSGGIGLKDAEAVKKFKHSRLHGLDVNSGFEIKPAQKDINTILSFLKQI